MADGRRLDPVERTRRTYERIAEAYDERIPDAAAMEPLLTRLTGRLPGSGRVLDLGCGTGRDARWFGDRGYDVVGVDLAAAQLRVAEANAPGASLCRADVRSLPFRDAWFDGCWCAAVLLHLPRAAVGGALREARRVLSPGAPMFCSVKRGSGSGVTRTYGTDTGRYVVAYEPDELEGRLVDAGFEMTALTADERWVEAVVRA
jgi:SAM-dependent methyltransferase